MNIETTGFEKTEETEYQKVVKQSFGKLNNLYAKTTGVGAGFVSLDTDGRFGTAYAAHYTKHVEHSFKNMEDAKKVITLYAEQQIENRENILSSFRENVKQNPNDFVLKNKLEAIEDIYKEVDKILGKDAKEIVFTEKNEKYLAEFITAHELGHVYFPNRNNPHYNSEINSIELNENQMLRKISIGRMRDEIRADTLAMKMLGDVYVGNQDFKDTTEKIRASRLLGSISSIINNDSEYNMYEIYKDGGKFIKEINLKDKNDLEKVEEKIDQIVLNNLKNFGLVVNEHNYSVNKNDGTFNYLEKSTKNFNNVVVEMCKQGAPQKYKGFVDEGEDCIKSAIYTTEYKGLENAKNILETIPLTNGDRTINLENLQDTILKQNQIIDAREEKTQQNISSNNFKYN